MFRPRFSNGHSKELRSAAALAGLSPSQYLEQVVRPLVQEDHARRLESLGMVVPDDGLEPPAVGGAVLGVAAVGGADSS